MQRINLPSGATADLRDVADVTERMRRPVKRLQAKLTAIPEFGAAVREAEAAQKTADGELSPDQQMEIAAGMGAAFDVLEDLNDALCAAMVAGWSFGGAVSADAMQDLPGRDLDALRTACTPFLPQLNPNFEPSPDDASPIEPSGA
jgi:hypothetical protein